MARKDLLMLKQKELRRLHVVHKVLQGEITQSHAAELIGLSCRQIRRIVKRIRAEGDQGIIHRSRGRESNRKLPQKLANRLIELYRRQYVDFGPTLTAEKLLERDGICVSKETVRTVLLESGDWKRSRKVQEHRQWRQRKQQCGEMLQMDGSHHDWFEGRGPKCVLMAYIDDATSRVYGRFYAYEGTIPAMDSFWRYIRKYGLPMELYADKHSTYKSPSKETELFDRNGNEIDALSQFERAMKELSVEMIHAHSPQAKGRVERLFKTLQDRLVKEMRLRGISNVSEANRFLQYYLPVYNRKFSVMAASTGDLHRPLPDGVDLQRILCIKTKRTVRNDRTIMHQRQLYQIDSVIAPGKKVIVEERLKGEMAIAFKGTVLQYRQITERPPKVVPERKPQYSPRKNTSAPYRWKELVFGKRLPSEIKQQDWREAKAAS